jgi:hypothetical protein
MKANYLLLLVLGFTLSCSKEDPQQSLSPLSNTVHSQHKTASTLLESFESGTKTSYTTANVTLSTGVWSLSDALLGNSSSDPKNGSQSARIRNSGKLSMQFDKTGGVGNVTLRHALYGTDGNCSFQVFYSTNGGTSYTAAGNAITCSLRTLTDAIIPVNVSGNVRIEIRKTDASTTNRFNIDDIGLTDYAISNPAPTLTSLSATSAVQGTSSLTLTLTGTGFATGTSVLWNGTSSLTPTIISSSSMSVVLSATQLATAGTFSVAVVNSAPGGGTSSSISFTVTATVNTGVKRFLFDAKHGETAGNADWVIDEDNSTPQQIPTPLQSTVTSATAETYWTGALSSWGIALAAMGHTVQTLPTSGSLTYGNASNPLDLSKFDVFVVDEPNKVFTATEKTAILQFIQNGGGLIMISDHTQSDRDNDGWDSPAIWNDFMTNNTVKANPFGFSIDLQNFSGTSTNRTSITINKILNGSKGVVSSVNYANGTSITLNTTANSTATGLMWKSGATQNTSNVICASATYGTGRVFVLGDSSPVDDGTGAPGNTLYNGWGTNSHAVLMLNASLWCAKLQ